MKRKKTVWKIISIVFIVLFVLILIGGMLRAHFFRSMHSTATEAQIVIARNAALSSLNSKGIDVSAYTVKTSSFIRTVDSNVDRNVDSNVEKNIHILDVTIYNASVRHAFIVDVDTGKIQIYSYTEFYDGLDHSILQDRRSPGFPREATRK